MAWTAMPKPHPKLASCMEATDGNWLIIKLKPFYSMESENFNLVLNFAVFTYHSTEN
jgi:hypothetical protein